MKIQKLPVVCEKCTLRFKADIAVQCPVSVAIASMKAVICPECGSKKVGIELKKSRKR